jgi:hypothetical protein
MRTTLVIPLALALAAANAAAQSSEPAQDPEHVGWIDKILNKLSASKQVDLSHGIDWGVLPGPFYNPEMGFGIGAAAIGLYKPKNAEEDTQLSTVNIHGFATTTGALGIGVDNNTFFADDSYRFVFSGALINIHVVLGHRIRQRGQRRQQGTIRVAASCSSPRS